MQQKNIVNETTALIASICSIAASIFGLLRIIKEDKDILGFIALFLCGSLWLFLVYIAMSRKDSSIKSPLTRKYLRIPRYGKKTIRYACCGIALVPLLILFLFLHPLLRKNNFFIIVTDFNGPDREKYRVTEIMLDELHDLTKEYPNIQIKYSPQEKNQIRDSSQAQVLGKKNKAAFVIWGYYGATAEKAFVSMHLDVIQEPILGELLNSQQTFIPIYRKISEMQSFTLQESLSSGLKRFALFTHGLIKFKGSDFNGAINLFSKALAISSDELQIVASKSIILLLRGVAYLFSFSISKSNWQQDRRRSAINDFSEVIQSSNSQVSQSSNKEIAYLGRAFAYLMLSQKESAIGDLQKAAEIEANQADAHCLSSLVSFFRGDAIKALASINKGIELDSGNAFFYYLRAWYCYDLEKYDSAMADLKKTKKLVTNLSSSMSAMIDLFCQYLQGIIRYGQDMNQEAITIFSKIIQHYPDSYLGYFGRAFVENYLKAYEHAIADYSRSIELNPAVAELYFERADPYKKTGAINAAIADYSLALQLNPSYGEALRNRSLLYGEKGYYDYAIADLDNYLRLTPLDSIFLYNRAFFKAHAGKNKEAMTDLIELCSIKHSPQQNSFPLMHNVLNKLDINELNEQLNLLQSALNLEPGNERIIWALADAHFHMGHYHEAQKTNTWGNTLAKDEMMKKHFAWQLKIIKAANLRNNSKFGSR